MAKEISLTRLRRRAYRASMLGPMRDVVDWNGASVSASEEQTQHETLRCGHILSPIIINGKRRYPQSRRCSICLFQDLAGG